MVLQKILYYWNLYINWLGSSVLNPLIRKFFHSQSIRIPFSCKLLIFDDEIYYLNSCKMILRLISIHALSLWEKETVTFHFSIKDRSRRNCHRILWIWVISLLLLLSWKSFTSFTTRATPSHSFYRSCLSEGASIKIQSIYNLEQSWRRRRCKRN